MSSSSALGRRQVWGSPGPARTLPRLSGLMGVCVDRGLQSGSRRWMRDRPPLWVPYFTLGPARTQRPSWLRSQAARCWPRAALAGLCGSLLRPRGESRQMVRWAPGMQLGRHPQEGRSPPRKHKAVCADASLGGTGLVRGEPQCASAPGLVCLVHPRGHGLPLPAPRAAALPAPRHACPLCPSIIAILGWAHPPSTCSLPAPPGAKATGAVLPGQGAPEGQRAGPSQAGVGATEGLGWRVGHSRAGSA